MFPKESVKRPSFSVPALYAPLYYAEDERSQKERERGNEGKRTTSSSSARDRRSLVDVARRR